MAKTAVPPAPSSPHPMDRLMSGMGGAAAAAPAPAPAAAPAPAPAPTPSPVATTAARRSDGPSPAVAAGVLVSPSQPRMTGASPVAGRTTGAVSRVSAEAAPAPQAKPRAHSEPVAPIPAVTPADGVAATPGPARAGDSVICPKCGKAVGGSFAFCGGCGYRLKGGASPAGAAASAAAVPRTMFMAPAPKVSSRGHLTLIRPDGTEGGMHPLQDGENLIGRGQGSLFDADPYLSPRHAEFIFGDEGLVVRDLRSLNGVFVKIGQEERLESGDIFRIGQELLRFDLIAPAAPLEDGTEIIGTPNPGYWGRISVIVGRDVDGPAFPLFDESIVLGRERGDILFTEDGYVSGTHAQIALRGGQVFLSDLGSSNGTFFRIRGSRPVAPGSLILMGQQLFRVSYR
jgi:pSer/pThr/pTyr-binding forkhead associated (FHA) protein